MWILVSLKAQYVSGRSCLQISMKICGSSLSYSSGTTKGPPEYLLYSLAIENLHCRRTTTAPGFRIVVELMVGGGSDIRGGLCIWLGAGWLATIPLCSIPCLLLSSNRHAICNFCVRHSHAMIYHFLAGQMGYTEPF